LFKLTVPEEIYFAEAEKFSLLFNHPSVEGVYEKQLPLNLRTVLQLGNRCTIDQSQPGVLGKGIDHDFDLSSLTKPTKPTPYLDGARMSYIYLSYISAGDRQIFGVFSTTGDKAHIIIQQKNKDGGQDLPNITKLSPKSVP
jgi:DNA polymerase epsilon subunit 1